MEINNPNPNKEAPLIPESEMKLPEEQVGGIAPPPAPSSHLFNPILFGLLIVLLVILGVVIIWGEQLLNMVLPPENYEMPIEPVTTEQPEESSATELQATEAELNQMNFEDMDAELDAIEASMDAELEAGATTSNTRCDPGERC